jgi:hypothetical protein
MVFCNFWGGCLLCVLGVWNVFELWCCFVVGILFVFLWFLGLVVV